VSPIPALDHRGLLPPGRYKATSAEIYNAFCVDAYRTNLWLKFEDFILFLKQQFPDVNYPLALSGSFFTDKVTPSDVDCAILIPEDAPPSIGWALLLFLNKHRDAIKLKFKVDFFISAPGVNDFQALWEYVGPKTAEAKNLDEKDRRGILVIEKW